MREKGQAEIILRVLAYAIFIYALILIIRMILEQRTTLVDFLVVIIVGILLELMRIESRLGNLEGKIESLTTEGQIPINAGRNKVTA